MNKEQLAATITGRQYRDEMEKEHERMAKENGLLVVFGASDHLMEFRGVINDEVGAYDGGSVILFKHKEEICIVEVDDIDELEDARKEVSAMDARDLGNIITSEWCPDTPRCSWIITTKLPHATFDIMEDEKLYCRGVVIDAAGLFGAKAQMDVMQKIVAAEYGKNPADLFVKCRKKELVEPRQIIQFFANSWLKINLSITGTITGGFDHASALHSVRTVRRLYYSNRAYRSRVDAIIGNLNIEKCQIDKLGLVAR